MDDRAFLVWLRDRLVHHYGEFEHVDFVRRLDHLISRIPPETASVAALLAPDPSTAQRY